MENKSKNQRNQKNKIWILIFIIFLLFMVIYHKQKISRLFLNKQELKEENPVEKIYQYNHSTFSEFFFSESWIDLEKTNLFLDKEKEKIVYQKENTNQVESFLKKENNIETQQIVSKKFNFSVKEIKAAQITQVNDLKGSGEIRYYFSNNNGETWILNQPGEIIVFEEPGNKLKWAAEVFLENNSEETIYPEISSIYFKYWYQR